MDAEQGKEVSQSQSSMPDSVLVLLFGIDFLGIVFIISMLIKMLIKAWIGNK